MEQKVVPYMIGDFKKWATAEVSLPWSVFVSNDIKTHSTTFSMNFGIVGFGVRTIAPQAMSVTMTMMLDAPAVLAQRNALMYALRALIETWHLSESAKQLNESCAEADNLRGIVGMGIGLLDDIQLWDNVRTEQKKIFDKHSNARLALEKDFKTNVVITEGVL